MKSIAPITSFSCTHARGAVTVQRQRGASLFIALVALVLMTIAGFSLMRSVDTGNVIAGNMAFREVTVQAADLGIEAAAAYLNVTVSPSPDANLPNGCTVASVDTSTDPDTVTLGTCLYSSRLLPEDDNGVPYVNWASANIPETNTNGVSYKFVVERLCDPSLATLTVGQAAKYLQVLDKCVSSVLDPGLSSSGGSAYGGGSVSKITPIHYRVTVRTSGPRNTVSFVQTLMLR